MAVTLFHKYFLVKSVVPAVKDIKWIVIINSSTNINNYMGITVSPCISKILEMCILHKCQHPFTNSLLQFGFSDK